MVARRASRACYPTRRLRKKTSTTFPGCTGQPPAFPGEEELWLNLVHYGAEDDPTDHGETTRAHVESFVDQEATVWDTSSGIAWRLQVTGLSWCCFRDQAFFDVRYNGEEAYIPACWIVPELPG